MLRALLKPKTTPTAKTHYSPNYHISMQRHTHRHTHTQKGTHSLSQVMNGTNHQPMSLGRLPTHPRTQQTRIPLSVQSCQVPSANRADEKVLQLLQWVVSLSLCCLQVAEQACPFLSSC
mmetsp:Transcript_25078/g.72382  ORF Transcript_25078/g.72382 Transcript_25078/m.72382 type:complete len:119 (-) Transcript_25078:583-939(-)